jgi:hypothetical protein
MWKNGKIILWALILNFRLSAQNPGDMKGFYGSLNMGPGIVNGNISSYDIETSLRFAMHFNIGYFITNKVQIGLSGCGWLFEPYMWTGSGYTGESVSTTMFQIQVYPVRQYRWFLKGGYGISKYTNLHPDKDYGRGNAFMIATAYEQKFGKGQLLWGFQLSYQYGKLRYGNLYTPTDELNRRFHVVDFTLFLGLD